MKVSSFLFCLLLSCTPAQTVLDLETIGKDILDAVPLACTIADAVDPSGATVACAVIDATDSIVKSFTVKAPTPAAAQAFVVKHPAKPSLVASLKAFNVGVVTSAHP